METRNTGKAKGKCTGSGDEVYADAEMRQYLIDLSKELGKIPTSIDIKQNRMGPSVTSYYNRGPKSLAGWIAEVFGSYKKQKKVKYTDAFLVAEMQRFNIEFNKIPTFDSISKASDYPSGAVYSKRGGFSKFLISAGFGPNKIHNYNEAELLSKIKDLTESIGRVPASGDLKKAREKDRNYPDPSVYFSKMSWAKWIKKAGMVPIFRKYTDNDLEYYLLKAYKDLGRAPTTEDMGRNNGLPHATVYMHRGGWSNWLKKCGIKKTKRYVTKDGHITKSRDEATIDDWLSDHNIVHGYEPKYLGDCRYRADFYVNGIYYEYCGLASKFPEYDRKMNKKLKYGKEQGMNIVLIYPKDLDNLENIFLRNN